MYAELVEAPRPAPNPIAGYEDWPAAVRSAEPYVGADWAGTTLGGVLGLRRIERPTVRDDGSRRLDGVLIQRLRWSVGYGPETTAWLLRPAGVRRSLPGVLGMHCHGGIRSVGAEQLVDLGVDSTPRAFGFVMSTTRVGLPLTSWLVRVMPCSSMTPSPGAADGSTCLAPRLGSPPSSRPKTLCGGSRVWLRPMKP
jgi:hypothetical protein